MRLRVVITAVLAAGLIAAPSALAAPDPEIAGLQVALRSKGLYFGKIDGMAGPMTAKGLRVFQRLTHLPVTGEITPTTRAELGALGRPLTARRVLGQGAYGWDVSELQFLLARAGHLRLLDLDGHFGASTKAAVVRFQRSRGLSADGVAGPATSTAFGHGRRTPVVTRSTAGVSAYVVRPGDTLTAIATKHRTTVRTLAKVNNLNLQGVLLEGAKLRVPSSSASAAAELSRSTVRSHIDRWSARYGVPNNLARAIAWQESGFQTNITSPVGAWGPMQVMPDAWAFVETVLLGGRQVPRTGDGGVEVGVALLAHLLRRFNGDQRLAVAAWYQGERAVRERGLYGETKTFVANVLALSGRQI